jgi:two-component system, OmpR family, alkaline phosphatase synthesis response regulator PhoP
VPAIHFTREAVPSEQNPVLVEAGSGIKQRRALIVDDEPALVDILKIYLQDEGFSVTMAIDGAEGLKTAIAEPFDVVLLDLNLPSMSGVEVFKEIRKVSDVPILMVTSRDEAVDRIVGLELGADDYIAKPFNPREVVVRVKNIIRRTERKPVVLRVEHDVQQVGDLTIDRTGHEVRLSGAVVKLTPMEYRILDVLTQNAGIALTRSQLLDKINTDSAEVFDRTLDKHIANLRGKIGDDPHRPRYITTIQGVGYKVAE